MIAREREIRCLLDAFESDRSEFVAVYGRRRIGKTFLIKETFKNRFTFLHTGAAGADTKEQLFVFRNSLVNAGLEVERESIKDWFEAFYLLESLIRQQKTKRKKVIFLDELPWMDTPNSRFISALEHFWNGFAYMRDDILLLVCGSATSWMINNVINNYGGLYNRLTSQIYLRPFTLRECEKMVKWKGLSMSRREILQGYMALGGIPYYWTLFEKEKSFAQNVDSLCFSRGGALENEFNRLLASLFRHPDSYVTIISALATKKIGMTREEVSDATGLGNGGKLSQWLKELEQCDFIRSYNSYGNRAKGTVYQLIDGFTLFYFRFMRNKITGSVSFWSKMQGTPKFNVWAGLAFERVCLLHTEQIRHKLGVSGVFTSVQAWRSNPKTTPKGDGAQIDLLIERGDGVINLCEMKFSGDEYVMKDADYREIHRKAATFRSCTHTRKALHLTLVTTSLHVNEYSHSMQNIILADDLFAEV